MKSTPLHFACYARPPPESTESPDDTCDKMIEILLGNCDKSSNSHTSVPIPKVSSQNKNWVDKTDTIRNYVNMTNSSGQTALCLAAQQGLVKSVNRLLVHWSRNDENLKFEIESAIKSNNLEILKAVLEKIKPDKPSQLLHLTCKYNNNREVDADKSGRDIDNVTGFIFEFSPEEIYQANDEGYTPLLIAAHFGHYNCVKYLCKVSEKIPNAGE
jgi:ankyrin repeat protein